MITPRKLSHECLGVVMSNNPFIPILDCDHYIYNSEAVREGMCYMMDRNGDMICYVQFPQWFEELNLLITMLIIILSHLM
jgi:hypothetical protein